MKQPFTVFDLHCDTLTAFMDPNCKRQVNTLNAPSHQFALCKIPQGVRWAQCCAIFIPDSLDQDDAISYYHLHLNSFHRQMSSLSDMISPCDCAWDVEQAWVQGKHAAILTVENGTALGGKLSRVEQLRQDGVQMMTLTWNGENEIGSGNATHHGLSPFGRAVIPEMERHGILVDVSHLNDFGFYDLLNIASKPFVASHSNARAICPHPRNLTDEQIRELVNRGCLIGLNYCNAFLRSDGYTATWDDLYRHVEHFLMLGAERNLALGSDFDGAQLPPCLDAPAKIPELSCYLQARGLSETLVQNIMWHNAFDFFQNNLV